MPLRRPPFRLSFHEHCIPASADPTGLRGDGQDPDGRSADEAELRRRVREVLLESLGEQLLPGDGT